MSSERLTGEQAYFARRQFNRWLRLKEQHEPSHVTPDGKRWEPNSLTFLCADVDHSALLIRLLTGREPLPVPPPKEHGYPVYPEDAS